MRFSHIELKNWRNFTAMSVDLHQRVFLVGPNASGKSNLIDAFRFLGDLVAPDGGFLPAIRRRGGISAMRSLAARQHPEIEMTFIMTGADSEDNWEYTLRFTQDNRSNPVIKAEIVKKGGRIILSRPDDSDGKDSDLLRQTHLEQASVNKDFRDLHAFFGSIYYLHIVPQMIRLPDRITFLRNDPYGSDFLTQIAEKSPVTRDRRLKRIQEALQKVTPQLSDLTFERDQGTGRPHLKARYMHWRQGGAWQKENSFSDGTLRLIGILWALLEAKGPILLEEPELSLHSGVIRFLPQMFQRIQSKGKEKRQFVISSHSSDLFQDQGLGADEVILLRPENEKTTVQQASSVTEIVALLASGMSLGEAIMPYTAPQSANQLALL